MLILEFLLLITSTLYIIFSRVIHKKLEKKVIFGLLAILLTAHFLFDGYRWQMIPTYIMWVFAVVSVMRQPGKSTSRFISIAKVSGVLLLFTPALMLPILLPILELPEITGPYAVGTTDILLETERNEEITADTSDIRRFMIKTWYPSNETDGEQDLFIDRAGRNGFAKKYGLPPGMLNYLDKVDTNIFRNISLAEGTFPVLIFSHGYHSKANGYYALLSEMASHGYIIFAINHTYESTGTTFPDGTEVYFDNDYARNIESNTWETINPVIDAFKSGISFNERHPIVKKALTAYFARDIIERWARDITDVVDALDEWNRAGLFKGKLDLSSIGVFGHSRGGGAAGESLLTDDRIKAGANLDGVQWGRIVDTSFQKPFLFLASDWPEGHEDLNQHAYINKSRSIFYQATLLESGHSNFMDIPYMIPLQALNLAGDIDPGLAFEISNKLTKSFFDKHLKNSDVDLRRINSKYENLEMSIFRGDSLQSTQDAMN